MTTLVRRCHWASIDRSILFFAVVVLVDGAGLQVRGRRSGRRRRQASSSVTSAAEDEDELPFQVFFLIFLFH